MSMYVRLKHTNKTVFLNVDPTQKVSEVKASLAKVLGQDEGKTPSVDNINFLAAEHRETLDNDKTLDDSKVGPADIIYYVFKKGDGGWEDVDIPKPRSADDSDKKE
eukprot:TRINITY_DN332_c0_g1_i1.p1 TRINITY_DN332_c0_g1~~TRINITY_DN332_c0_g1_i1.p1  ORF type:complete len:106 (-),score=22.95 TRINITY_DN332_c0_g1_i1:269-586(-)